MTEQKAGGSCSYIRRKKTKKTYKHKINNEKWKAQNQHSTPF